MVPQHDHLDTDLFLGDDFIQLVPGLTRLGRYQGASGQFLAEKLGRQEIPKLLVG